MVNLKKTHDLHELDPVLWSRKNGQQVPCFDHNMGVQRQRCTYGNGATFLFLISKSGQPCDNRNILD